MRISPSILLAIALLSSLVSCSDQETTQRDLVLETANSFEEIAHPELAEGKKVFGKYCSVCHGVEGKGDGFNAFNLDPKPRDFSDPVYSSRVDSVRIVETISSGGSAMGLSPLMPAWGRTLSKKDIRNACYYVMYLSRVGTE
jgi:mono/diheme cytochrome c family protein